MQRTLMDILVCPLCKGDLELSVKTEVEDEIMEGTLVCTQCRERYPIDEGIPNMLSPDQRD